MSRNNGIGFATIIGVTLVFGTVLPANADRKDSPFVVSRQQEDNAGAVGNRPAGGFIGCQTVGAKPIFAGDGPRVPLPNPPLPMPIGEERPELPKMPSAESGEVP